MAGNRIKGITIEIGGDTTKLDKALAGTDKALKSTQASLKDVDLQAAAETYLTSHGMTAEQVSALQRNLGA